MFLSIHITPTKENAFWLLLKLRTKGVVYNWDYNKLKQITGLSRHVVKRNLEILINQGLIKEYGKNLNLSSFRLFKNKEIKLVYSDISEKDEYKKILYKLRHLHFKFHIINRQQYVRSTKDGIAKKGVNKLLLKKIKKLRKLDISLEESSYKGVCFGYRKVSKLLGISISEVKKFLVWMKSKGYISGFHENLVNLPYLTKNDLNFIETGRYIFNNGGDVYLHLGTRINI